MKRLSFALVLLLVFLPVAAQADYFDTMDNVEELYRAYRNVDYAPLKESVDAYIESARPPESDSAYAVRDFIDGNAETLESIDEVTDDFDGSRTFTFDGVTSLEDGYTVVPGYNDSDMIHMDVGFVDDDFIFFDQVAISVDQEVVFEVDLDDDEALTDVLDDGSVKEHIILPMDYLDDNAYSALQNGEKAVIRFLNTETEDKVQRELSQEEKSAICHGYELIQMHYDTRDYYNAYEESDAFQQLWNSLEPLNDCGNGYPVCPSGTKSRYNQQAKTTLDDEIFTGSDQQREALKGTVYIVTGALTMNSFYQLELVVDGKKLNIEDTEYSHEDGADYTMPEEGAMTNFILTFDHGSGGDSATFMLGAYEHFVTDLRTGA